MFYSQLIDYQPDHEVNATSSTKKSLPKKSGKPFAGENSEGEEIVRVRANSLKKIDNTLRGKIN